MQSKTINIHPSIIRRRWAMHAMGQEGKTIMQMMQSFTALRNKTLEFVTGVLRSAESIDKVLTVYTISQVIGSARGLLICRRVSIPVENQPL